MMHSLIAQAGRMLTSNRLSTLIYHQVFEQPDPMRPGEPDREMFRWQMALLKKHFVPLALPDALQRLQEGRLPANAVCVTFDDGYVNNLDVAQPILQEFEIPATVYIATGFSQGKNMWNDRIMDLAAHPKLNVVLLESIGRERVEVSDLESRQKLAVSLIGDLKYKPYWERIEAIDALYKENGISDAKPRMMTPDQICELHSKGVEIGAHTVDHPILSTLSAEQQLEQMRQCKTHLESWLDKPVTGFAYPNGKYEQDYNDDSVEMARQAGFDYAVTTNWGISDRNTNLMTLNRFTPWDGTPGKFHLRLLKNQLGV